MRARVYVAASLAFSALACMAGWLYHHTTRFDAIIAQAAARNEVDPYLVKALIYEESWFRQDIRGSMGEFGLMQVSRGAATDYSSRKGFPAFYETRLLEPELNVEIGCWYLRQSLDRYKSSPAPTLFALLRYNAGTARADGWLRLALSKPVPDGVTPPNHYLSQVDIRKTREYVRRILLRSQTRNFWF